MITRPLATFGGVLSRLTSIARARLNTVGFCVGFDPFADVRLRENVGADHVKRRLPAHSRIDNGCIKGANAEVVPEILVERAVLLEERVVVEEHVRHQEQRAAPLQIAVDDSDFAHRPGR